MIKDSGNIRENSSPVQQVSFLSDAPSEHDLLHYGDYADALSSIIEELTEESSLTIGVFGEWGSGKTTLLRMMQDRLKNPRLEKRTNLLRGLREKLEKPYAQTTWVDVWRLANEEDVWVAFLQSILIKVKNEMSPFRRLLFNLGLLRRQMNWRELARIVVRIAIVVVPLYFSLSNLNLSNLGSASNPERGAPFGSVAAAGAGTLVSVLAGWFLLIQPYFNEIRKRVNIDLTKLVNSSPLKERVVVLDQFRAYFTGMVESLVGRKGRVVIFIDDLDRCPPERITQVLDAIKSFLEIPNCVYVLGLDRGIVEEAVAARFDGYENPSAEAGEYLEKIIGLPFDLPPLSGGQMTDLVQGLNAGLPERSECERVFAYGQSPNPRKVKRTMNIFILLWTLSQRREELRQKIRPIRLAKIVVVQNSYRALYKEVLAFPECLGELEAHFRRKKANAGASASTEDLREDLKPFANNKRLEELLTLHHWHIEHANFTTKGNDYIPVSGAELKPYIDLTYSVSAERVYVPQEQKISLKVTSELEGKSLRFGVLHVRDGTDEEPSALLNVQHYLQKEDGNEYSTTIEYDKRLGFQFKCFVDYGSNDFAEIRELLEQAGFKSISRGPRNSQRAWFLLPEYAEYTTETGFENNFHLPG
jgi:hypothetical protein